MGEEEVVASVMYVMSIVVLAPLHLIGKSVNGHPIVVNVAKFVTPPTGVNIVAGLVRAVGIAGNGVLESVSMAASTRTMVMETVLRVHLELQS